MIRGQKIFTTVLSGSSITLTSEMGLTSVSIVLISGAGSYTGDLNVSDNITAIISSPIDLIINQAINVSSDSGLPLDGVTIDASAGVVNIMGRQ